MGALAMLNLQSGNEIDVVSVVKPQVMKDREAGKTVCRKTAIIPLKAWQVSVLRRAAQACFRALYSAKYCPRV
jgi:hypothetical protein